jgi:hypothetical protein
MCCPSGSENREGYGSNGTRSSPGPKLDASVICTFGTCRAGSGEDDDHDAEKKCIFFFSDDLGCLAAYQIVYGEGESKSADMGGSDGLAQPQPPHQTPSRRAHASRRASVSLVSIYASVPGTRSVPSAHPTNQPVSRVNDLDDSGRRKPPLVHSSRNETRNSCKLQRCSGVHAVLLVSKLVCVYCHNSASCSAATNNMCQTGGFCMWQPSDSSDVVKLVHLARQVPRKGCGVVESLTAAATRARASLIKVRSSN